ncbi:MAG TPA: UPF0182 family protein [Vicinamibacterales bacterium]
MPPVPRRLPLIVLAAAAFFLVPSFVDFYADWLWFGEVGYQHVLIRALSTKGSLWAGAFVITFAFLYANFRAAFRTMTRRELVIVTPDGPRVVVVDPSNLRTLVKLAAVAGGVLLGIYAASQWEGWLLYWYATPFGKTDPILGRDVGFYVFELPFLRWLQSLALFTLVLTTIGTVLIYISAGRLTISPVEGISVRPPALTHLSALAALWLVVLAFGAWLAIPDLLTSSSGLITGATYVDVHARIPALRALAVVAALGALLAAYQAFQERIWPVLTAFGLYVVVLVAGWAYATVLQRFVVAPNEQARETPFIVHNIQATRDAFALDRVEERELSGDAELTRADIERNALTLRNVPLWDHQPLLDTFGQIQEIRTYYDFVSVDNDRYTIDGEYRQIMLSARELNSESLPNRNWINERLTFTHGYGVTLGPVNQVTPEGLPVLFIRNLPPESTVNLPVDEPSIYFGELSNDHVFVRTRTREFHYPRGEDNVFTEYDGRGGVSVGSFTRKLLFAIRFRSLKILLSDDLREDSRILYHRRIGERVRLIAPFLQYDEDPHLAIDQGRLLWVQDAYTTSARYPYAERAGSINYIRNSIKVIIDAYHGTTTYYLIDPADPIAVSIGKAFPGLLRPVSEMPEGLRTRMRYPHTIFAIQAAMFSTYHMDNPAIFYNKEDQWEVPVIGSGNQAQRMEPYYAVMRLPGEATAEYIQMLPFTPRQKDNLAAWVVGRSDGDNYGRLMVFKFPKQKVVFGPRQVVARISQDQVISPQITLWNQQGSEVIQGTLLVIPIEESLIYVRPLYLRAQGGRIPELKRVIVAYQNQIVMEETLEEAVERIFGGEDGAARAPQQAAAAAAPAAAAGDAGTPVESTTRDLAALAAQARTHYDRAIAAQRAGDWARYGEELRLLGEVLQKMRGQNGQ